MFEKPGGKTATITKLVAAERQLREAIRMFFEEKDDLAVHTVASAAYRIICDLKSERGFDEADDYWLTVVFYAVRDFRRGKLPKVLADDPDFARWIRGLADRLPITSSSQYRDIRVRASSSVRDAFWRNRTKVANFLKHAKRDPLGRLPTGEVDNLELLMIAQSSYLDLVPDSLVSEGWVLWIYGCATNNLSDVLPPDYVTIAATLREASPDHRKKLCRELISRLSGPRSRTSEP